MQTRLLVGLLSGSICGGCVVVGEPSASLSEPIPQAGTYATVDEAMAAVERAKSGAESFPSLDSPTQPTNSAAGSGELNEESGEAVSKTSADSRPLFSFLPAGLTRSRWAMDDAVYRVKYENGAEKTEPLKKIKQAMDARFQKGKSGGYVSGGMNYRSESGGGALIDIGSESYMTSYLTGRISLMGTLGWDQASIGVDSGLRLQTPTRLAPFVGIGGFAGPNWTRVDISNDGIDNDEDGHTDESDEDHDWDVDAIFLAVYPEIGSHFWWSPRVRLSGFGRYFITTNGRDSDDWLFGCGIAVFGSD